MLRHLATSTCTILRAALANGERDPATATAVLSGLACTPVSAADVARLGALHQEGLIQSVSQVFETVVITTAEIRVSDLATIDDVAYIVVAAAVWPTMGATHVTLERVLQ